MPYCSNCGGKVDNEDRFCKHCGKSRTKGTSDSSSRNISKCPRCGEVVNAFDITCRSCGYEFRNKNTSLSLQQFKEGLENFDKELKIADETRQPKKDREYYQKLELIKERRVEYISNYSIPNTKEDIIEFIILASSNINEKILKRCPEGMNYQQYRDVLKIIDAWKVKFDQAYLKAEISFGNEREFEVIKRLYDEKKNKIKKIRGPISIEMTLIIMMALLMLPLIILSINSDNSKSKLLAQREAELNIIVDQIHEDINDGNYDSALLKANQIYLDDSFSEDSKKEWDERREEYIRIINEAKEKAEKGE